MYLGLFNYNKMPASVCMRECNTMVPQWGGQNTPIVCTLHRETWGWILSGLNCATRQKQLRRETSPQVHRNPDYTTVGKYL